ncbi:MAG: hypothetical protein IPM54_35060 [Polyangiaceae bacterium]|nr:hypothetical protein [Polyangiaceae bacterium]
MGRECDPCPGPTLDGNDLMTLGMDALNAASGDIAGSATCWRPSDGSLAAANAATVGGGGFVLTRLHMRYGKEGLGEDLVFRTAPPIVGGREFLQEGGKLETGAVQSSINNFQARYAIRHAWTGPVACANPRRGRWGGPPSGVAHKGTEAAQKLALQSVAALTWVAMVARDDNETKIDSGPLVPAPSMYGAPIDTTPAPTPTSVATSTPSESGASGPPATPPQSGCAGCRVGDANDAMPSGVGIIAAIGIALARMMMRSRRRK